MPFLEALLLPAAHVIFVLMALCVVVALSVGAVDAAFLSST
jgi:hypothetical protein